MMQMEASDSICIISCLEPEACRKHNRDFLVKYFLPLYVRPYLPLPAAFARMLLLLLLLLLLALDPESVPLLELLELLGS